MFNGLKDSLTSSAAKSMLASKLERYGRLQDLRISSRDKTIAVDVLLEGEAEAISIRIERYRISDESGGRALVIEKVAASRPWIQHLLEDMVVNKPLAVPSVVLLAL
jgi:hypothetical protein